VEMLTFLTKNRANSRTEESAHEEVQMKKNKQTTSKEILKKTSEKGER
jgi:hypothetical protein